jgi:hypothetical protein
MLVTTMKYCPDCGIKINTEAGSPQDDNQPNHKEQPKSLKRAYQKTSGILTIIAASLCLIISIAGIMFYQANSYSYYTNDNHAMMLSVGFLGLFTFALGLVSGVLILMKRLFSVAINGLLMITLLSFLSIAVNIWCFILIGIPIVILSTLGLVFASISREMFVS